MVFTFFTVAISLTLQGRQASALVTAVLSEEQLALSIAQSSLLLSSAELRELQRPRVARPSIAEQRLVSFCATSGRAAALATAGYGRAAW